MRHLLIILCSVSAVLGAWAADYTPRTAPPDVTEFTREVRDCFNQLRLPGLAVAIVKDGRIIHVQHEGFADLEQKTPIREGSISGWLR